MNSGRGRGREESGPLVNVIRYDTPLLEHPFQCNPIYLFFKKPFLFSLSLSFLLLSSNGGPRVGDIFSVLHFVLYKTHMYRTGKWFPGPLGGFLPL